MGPRPIQRTTLLACDRSRRSRLRKTVDFTIEPRPSGAVIPGAFTHSFVNGAVPPSVGPRPASKVAQASACEFPGPLFHRPPKNQVLIG